MNARHAQGTAEHRRATGEMEVTEVSDRHAASYQLLTKSQALYESPLSLKYNYRNNYITPPPPQATRVANRAALALPLAPCSASNPCKNFRRPPHIVWPLPPQPPCQSLLHLAPHRVSRTYRPRASPLPPHGRKAGRCGSLPRTRSL